MVTLRRSARITVLPVEIVEVVTVPVGVKPLAYNSLWQLRNDTWSSLEEATTQLALAGAQQRPVERLAGTVTGLLDVLGSIERFWAFPGAHIYREVHRLFADDEYIRLAAVVGQANRALVTESYRGGQTVDLRAEGDEYDRDARPVKQPGSDRPYFEVLVVEDLTEGQENSLREELRRWRRPDDPFVYEIVVVPSFDDALLAARLNFRLQACVVRRRFTHRSRHDSPLLAQFAYSGGSADLMERSPDDRAQVLARSLARIRPELDLYLMTEISVEDLAGRLSHHFRRIFHSREGSLELHLSILNGVSARYRAPFFSALRSYSHRPTGVFHALPISHGKSIVNSHWIKDMIDFYGLNIFLAETSATCGGLDSLLEPTGPLREAQELAAATFGSRQTFFVTNGTSTANKIVVQALVQPGDIVLVDRNCHQSHHYGLMLAGAMVTYLEAYPLNEYSMYGAVPLAEIKRRLLALRRAGKLDRVKMVLLTNCTFDGIVYDAGRVMEECLAIKPDLVFLWDEAWFAFARFHPVYRPRTAMEPPAPSPRSCACRSTGQPVRHVRRGGRPGRRRRRSGAAGAAAAARSGAGPGPGVFDRVDPQDADLAAAGVDDPRDGPGFQPEGRGDLPRGVHDAHLHLPELPDPRVPGPGQAAGGPGGVRAGSKADRERDAAPRRGR